MRAGRQWNIIQQVHVEGAWRVTKAAWPHLLKQKYGRIIMTSSASGLYGNGGQANYSAAKLALVGLANTLAKEGQKSGVYTNTIAPVAGSKMTETVWPPEMVEALSPQYVAPVVAYLCHESSKENGGVYESGGGFCAKVHYQRSEGVHFPIKGGAFTPEAIAARWTEINSFERNATYPTALNDSMAAVMAGIGQAPVQMGRSSANKQVQARSTNGTESKAAVEGQFASDIIFQGLAALVKADPTIPQRLNAIVQYNVTNAKKEKKVWIASLRKKDGAGSIAAGELQRDDNRKPDVTIDVSDADYCDLAAGKATAQMLYMKVRSRSRTSESTAGRSWVGCGCQLADLDLVRLDLLLPAAGSSEDEGLAADGDEIRLDYQGGAGQGQAVSTRTRWRGREWPTTSNTNRSHTFNICSHSLRGQLGRHSMNFWRALLAAKPMISWFFYIIMTEYIISNGIISLNPT